MHDTTLLKTARIVLSISVGYGLGPLEHWDHGLESRSNHGCMPCDEPISHTGSRNKMHKMIHGFRS
jgi:hypothetical protein